MKHSVKIISVFIAALAISAFVLTGCPHQSSNPVEEVEPLVLNGKIEIESGAFPSDDSGAISNRAASYDASTLDLSDYEFSVKAVHADTGYEMTGTVNIADHSYSILIPSTGTWKIQIAGTRTQNGQTCTLFFGETPVYVYFKYLELYGKNILYSDVNPYVSLQPFFKSGETGYINLAVRTTLPQTATSKKYKVKWLWGDEKPESAQNAEVQMDYAENSVSDYFTFNNAPLAAGAYKVTIQFWDDAETTLLYSTDQWIHVFGGFTTNCWYGNGPQYSKDGENKIWLTLTQEGAASFALVSGIPASSRNVWYNYLGSSRYEVMLSSHDEGFDSFNATQVPQNMTYLDGDIPRDFSEEDIYPELTDVFCIGKDGTIYIVAEGSDYMTFARHYICEYKVDGTVNWYEFYDETDDSTGKYLSYLSSLYYDHKTDKLYGMIEGEPMPNGKIFTKLYEFDLDISTHTAEHYVYPQILGSIEINSFAVCDNYLYFPFASEGSIKLLCYEFSRSPEKMTYITTLKVMQTSNLIYQYSSYPHEFEVTDMICIDDNLYILVKDYYVDTRHSIYSRGGVIKYNLFNKALEGIAGFAASDANQANDEILRLPFFTGEGSNKNIVYKKISEDPEEYEKYLWDDAVAYLYAPDNSSGLSQTQFISPQKFIYYDSNELLVADSGYAFFVNTHNEYYYATFDDVNRVMKVDLKTFEVDDCIPIQEEKQFTKRASKDYLYGEEALPDNSFGETLYTFNGNTWEAVSSSARYYPYIPRVGFSLTD